MGARTLALLWPPSNRTAITSTNFSLSNFMNLQPIELSPYRPKTTAKPAGPDDRAAFSLTPLAVTCADFIATPLPPRRRLLGNWLFAGDLGAIIASRGSGKTWFTMLISKAIATGTALGDWAAPDEQLRVGIYDSEMALEDLHERAASCGLADVQKIFLLSYSSILQARQRPLNLANLEDHALLIEWAKDEKLDVVFLDNLTTSVSGVEENGNDDFRDKVQPLLLSARAAGITLIIVGHLGRSGKWRGASGKEDLLDWTLKLVRDEDSEDDRLVVKSHFDKFRRSRDGNGPLRWTIRAAAGEEIDITSEPFQGVEAMIALIAAGVTKPSELAEELGVTGSCISKWGKKGMDSGRLAQPRRGEWGLSS
jgi:AAA domain